MQKRSLLFVILSAIITGAAVYGWMPGRLGAVDEGIKASDSVAKEEVKAPEIHESVVSLIEAGDGLYSAEMLVAGTNDGVAEQMNSSQNVAIRLANPNTVPSLDEPSAPFGGYPEALKAFSKLETFKNARSLAIVDLKNGKVLESSDSDVSEEMIRKIREKGISVDGLMHQVSEGEATRFAWHCLDDSMEKCLLAESLLLAEFPEEIRCDIANGEFYVCDGVSANTIVLFGASDCTQDQARDGILQAIMAQGSEIGQIEEGGRSFQFAKTRVKASCDLISFVEASAREIESEAVQIDTGKGNGRPSLQAIALAIGGGVVMLLLGIACTRRKKEDVEAVKSSDESGKLKELRKECEAIRKECDDAKRSREAVSLENTALKQKVEKLESAVEDGSARTKQLNEQLEFAKTAFKQEQITRMSLAEENRRLEDAAVSNNTHNTVVESPIKLVRSANSSSNFPNVPQAGIPSTEKKTEDIHAPSEMNRVTAPAQDAGLEELTSKEKSQAFFDALSDDGWDEIAESFDAIFTKTSNKSGEFKTEEGGTGADVDERSYGVTGFLNMLNGASERSVLTFEDSSKSLSSRETGRGMAISSEMRSTVAGIPSLSPEGIDGPREGKGATDANGHRSTLFGIGAVNSHKPELNRVTSTDFMGVKEFSQTSDRDGSSEHRATTLKERVTTPNISSKIDETSKRETKGENDESFKPSPSWTGTPLLPEAGVDQTSLYNALKRRAKDVSEMEFPAADANKKDSKDAKSSGAFEYNRGLSKSGVFSLTGSRVDIDPLSDNEYFKSLYDKFIELQKECGESTNKFTLEQFVSRLAREKERLMKTYHCRTVKFTVYIKDGKASLKATPQK